MENLDSWLANKVTCVSVSGRVPRVQWPWNNREKCTPRGCKWRFSPRSKWAEPVFLWGFFFLKKKKRKKKEGKRRRNFGLTPALILWRGNSHATESRVEGVIWLSVFVYVLGYGSALVLVPILDNVAKVYERKVCVGILWWLLSHFLTSTRRSHSVLSRKPVNHKSSV